MIQFTDDLLIGNGQIDTEHQMLFELINKTHDQIDKEHCSIENAMELVRNLENYAQLHFKHEEDYMFRNNDPEYALQIREHNVFRSKISEYSGLNLQNEQEALIVLEELLKYLAEWLYKHIISSDTMIGNVPVLDEQEKENAFQFSAKYRSGIPFIDQEHKGLFALIEKAYNTLHSDDFEEEIDCVDAVLDVLDELKQYTVTHFSHEEEYMQKIGYSGYPEQRKAHQAFIYKIEDIHEELKFGDVREYLEDLVEFLLFWLTNHIGCMDLKIPQR